MRPRRPPSLAVTAGENETQPLPPGAVRNLSRRSQRGKSIKFKISRNVTKKKEEKDVTFKRNNIKNVYIKKRFFRVEALSQGSATLR